MKAANLLLAFFAIASPVPESASLPPLLRYIDAGANDGSSVLSFLGQQNKTLNTAFDGSRKAPGFETLRLGLENTTSGIRSGAWHVYAFEANPFHNERLTQQRQQLLASGAVKTYKLFNATALSCTDGNVEFFLDNFETGSAGSTLRADSKSAKGRKIKIISVDVVTLFRTEQFRSKDVVVLKMDIEGAEYDVMRRLIVSGLLARYVDKVLVEWHHDAWQVFGHTGNDTDTAGNALHYKYKKQYETIMALLADAGLADRVSNWG